MLFLTNNGEGLKVSTWVGLVIGGLTLLGMILGGAAAVYSRPTRIETQKMIETTSYLKEKGVKIETKQVDICAGIVEIKQQNSKIIQQLYNLNLNIVQYKTQMEVHIKATRRRGR